MFFKGLVEAQLEAPDYFVSDILEQYAYAPALEEDPKRRFLGTGNKTISWHKMNLGLKIRLEHLNSFIASQQLPLLKNLVAYTAVVVQPPEEDASEGFSMRYADKIGELIVVPLRGNITISSQELGVEHMLMPGFVYRVNNRVGSSLKASPDALAVANLMIDFDLRHYLMEWDLSGKFLRQPEES